MSWIDGDPVRFDDLDSLPGVLWHLTDTWTRRTLDNVVLIHHSDLLADLDGQMRRLAGSGAEERGRAPQHAGGVRRQMVGACAHLIERGGGDHGRPIGRGDGAAEPVSGSGAAVLTPQSEHYDRRAAALAPAQSEHYDLRAAALAPADLRSWLHR